jgi:hypothetical protein
MLKEFRLELKKSSISQLSKLLVRPIHDLIRSAASGFCRVLRNLAGVNKQGFRWMFLKHMIKIQLHNCGRF